MTINQEIYLCKKIINNYNISDGQFNFVEQKLKSLLEKEDNYKVYILLGKLYLTRENATLANIYFLKALHLNSEAQSIYYGLFKVSILKKDYKSAKENLEKFISLDKTNKQSNNKLNLDLYRLLIDTILKEQSEYNIDDVYFYEKLAGTNLIFYLNTVKYILDEQYVKAIEALTQLDLSVKETKLPIGFQYVIKLVTQLKKNKDDEIKQTIFDEKYTLLKEQIQNVNVEEIQVLINELFQLDLNDHQMKILLHKIPQLLHNDLYDIACQINKHAQKIDKDDKYSRKTAFYQSLINELNEIYALTGETKENFQTFLRNGIEYLNTKNYQEAIDCFSLGVIATEIDLFHYYIGKAYFKLGKYKKAKKELIKYQEKGAYKKYLCKHYLSLINQYEGNKGKAIQLSEDAEYFANLLNKDFSNKYQNFSSTSDNKLIYLFHTIDLTEEDFMSGKQFTKTIE